jgi:hypothetical protein
MDCEFPIRSTYLTWLFNLFLIVIRHLHKVTVLFYLELIPTNR